MCWVGMCVICAKEKAWALSSEEGYFKSGAIAYIVIYSVFLGEV